MISSTMKDYKAEQSRRRQGDGQDYYVQLLQAVHCQNPSAPVHTIITPILQMSKLRHKDVPALRFGAGPDLGT